MSNDFRDRENDDSKNRMNEEESENGIDKRNMDGNEVQEKVEKEDQKELEENEKDFREKEEDTSQEARADDEKETSACEEEDYHQEENERASQIGSDASQDAEGSYSYAPHYSSSFSERDGKRRGEEHKNKSRKRRGSFGLAIIAIIVALAIALVALLPTLLMNVGLLAVNGFVGLGNIIDGMFDIEVNQGDQYLGDGGYAESGGVTNELNVTKNDGSINVIEQVGSTGYSGNLSVAEVVALVADTVVEITTTNVVTDRFYGQYVTSGAGSGVIIDSDGYIITNHHVIDGARSITVRLTDGSEFAATLVGSDESSDIALLKIGATGLNAAVLGSSASLVVGQEVVAIGNPLGSLGGTVTDGIISALDRTVVVDGNKMTLMQTNAAINPGNSGGGLFNRAGELIGIVNAKESDTGIEGLGFAIPIDIAWGSVKAIVS